MQTTQVKNESPKTRQEMLDKENPTPKEWAIQQLLIANSKTSLEAHKRVLRKIAQALYKTSARQLTLDDVIEAIEIAQKLAADDKKQ